MSWRVYCPHGVLWVRCSPMASGAVHSCLSTENKHANSLGFYSNTLIISTKLNQKLQNIKKRCRGEELAIVPRGTFSLSHFLVGFYLHPFCE